MNGTNGKWFDPFPEWIRKIAVAAPASAPQEENIFSAVRTAEELGREVVLAPHLFGPSAENYFSADEEYRLSDLNGFLKDESIDLLLCARGGYGIAPLLPGIDFASLRKRKHPLVIGGYSDVTALHLAMLSEHAGLPVACPMFNTLPRTASDQVLADSMRRAFSAASGMSSTLKPYRKLIPLSGTGKEVSGRLVPANLTLLTRLCGTKYLPSPEGTVLILEEVGELPRKIDFSFVQLLLSGYVQKCSAVILGDYTDCGTDEELSRVFARFAGKVRIPVFSGLNFGHSGRTLSFFCGEACTITPDGTLSLAGPCGEQTGK